MRLDNLKEKFVNYFKQFKSCNKDTIDKNQAIGENIDAIMKTISYYIKKEEDITTEAFETQTFGGDYNTNKSCLEIPLLDISAINEDKVGSSDSTYAWAIECDNNPKNFDKSQFYNKYPGLKPYECHNLSKEELYRKFITKSN